MVSLAIPASSFEEHAINVAAVSWLTRNISVLHVIHNLKFEWQFVNCNLVLAGIVLQDACDKGLWEEEA